MHRTLKNGVTIPTIGFGTWLIPEGDEVYEAVSEALKRGYRLIDTAELYANEKGIGRAIADASLPREDIFLTTKLPLGVKGYDATRREFFASLDRLNLSYIDLYLIHAPAPVRDASDEASLQEDLESWRAMEDLYEEGYVRAIGVSNFDPDHLEIFKRHVRTDVMVNQIQLHPGHIPRATIEACRKDNIAIEAYSPLAKGGALDDQRLRRLAERHSKTPAQIALRWCIEHGFIPLPKSATPSRMSENIDVFDFSLSGEDIAYIGAA